LGVDVPAAPAAQPNTEVTLKPDPRAAAARIVRGVIEEPRGIQPTLEPLDEFVVVQPLSDETETRAGLILPASATEAAPCRTGIVTEVGADANGVDVGDKVLYPRDAGYDVRLGGIDVKIVRREELIARIHD
jgi:chaperonin GroES